MKPDEAEATVAERRKALEDEERAYLEFLERIDRLSANPPPFERDPLLPELLADLNRAASPPAEERSEPGGLKGLAFRAARRLLAPELARLESALAREREIDSKLVQFLNRLSESTNASGARAAEFASALVGFAQRHAASLASGGG